MDSVLIIEDSRGDAADFAAPVRVNSLKVQIAPMVLRVWKIFRKQPPSVVVLDLKLPRLSGKELCRAFKIANAVYSDCNF